MSASQVMKKKEMKKSFEKSKNNAEKTKTTKNSENQIVKINDINWEFAFGDTRHIICRHLNFIDLYSLTHVDLMWAHIARREINKRDFIQLIALNYILQCILRPGRAPRLRVSFIDNEEFYTINTPPALAIMICDTKFNNYEDRVMMNLRKRIHGSMIMLIKSNKFLTTKDVDMENDGLKQRNSRVPNVSSLASLFFPTDEHGSRVRMAWTRPKYTDVTAEVHGIIRELYTSANPATYLLFAKNNQRVTHSATYQLSCFLAQGKRYGCVEWWAAFGDHLGLAQHNSNDLPEHPDLIVVKIAGLGVRSWTTIVDASLPYYDIIPKLYELKERIIPGRKCVGLVYADIYGNHLHKLIMLYLKFVFPDIPFVGMFGNKGREPLPLRLQAAGPQAARQVDGLFTPLMSIIIISIN